MKYFIPFFLFFSACTHLEIPRKPASNKAEFLVKKELLQSLRPKQIIELLKQNSEMNVAVIFEATTKVNWTDSDIAELSVYENDDSEIQPVVRITSDVICPVSNVAREIQHLKLAKTKGHYPLAQCSTYDLEF